MQPSSTTITGWALSRQCEILWQFHDISLTVHSTPAHVKCYSYHAGASVTVSGGGRNATMHDPHDVHEMPNFSKVKNGCKYAANNKQF